MKQMSEQDEKTMHVLFVFVYSFMIIPTLLYSWFDIQWVVWITPILITLNILGASIGFKAYAYAEFAMPKYVIPTSIKILDYGYYITGLLMAVTMNKFGLDTMSLMVVWLIVLQFAVQKFKTKKVEQPKNDVS
jgi:hypothetical protein